MLLQEKQVIEDLATGRKGVSTPDTYGLSEGADGAQVFWYGKSYQEFAEEGTFKVLGGDEAVADIDICSAKHNGGGSLACKFIGVSATVRCMRFTHLDASLKEQRDASAKSSIAGLSGVPERGNSGLGDHG